MTNWDVLKNGTADELLNAMVTNCKEEVDTCGLRDCDECKESFLNREVRMISRYEQMKKLPPMEFLQIMKKKCDTDSGWCTGRWGEIPCIECDAEFLNEMVVDK